MRDGNKMEGIAGPLLNIEKGTRFKTKLLKAR